MLTKNTDKLRAVVADHIAKDAVIQGAYWDKDAHRGCFIGCLARGNKPELNERQYGLTVMLQRIAENIFECLPAAEAKAFFAALPDAVGCDGKDLTRVGWQFLAAELRALPQQEADIQVVIESVIVGIEHLAVGQEWREATSAAKAAAKAAESAATSAAKAAAEAAAEAAVAAAAKWAAVDAEWAVAWAAAAAEWAAKASAADAAAEATEWAVEAAEWAAGLAAESAAAAARRRQRDLLLRLIAEAPIIEENL